MNVAKNIFRLLVLYTCIVTSESLYSQTASVTSGCSELKVEFTAPSASSYYWIFGDGGVSDLQNPVHSYIQSGDFTVQLFDMENGTQVGNDIIITVYPPIEYEVSADTRFGCAPLTVDFSSQITIHPDIDVQDIVWTFGDGASASGQDATYTYRESGTYTVSLKVITTDNVKCDEPIILTDYITVEGNKTSFRINKDADCDVPADFVFTNTTDAQDGSTYSWDFDNGVTDNTEGPHQITYNAAGLYTITLTTTTPSGCVTTSRKNINIGSPVIVTSFPDTICIGESVRLIQSTIADSFYWEVTDIGMDIFEFGDQENDKNPTVEFATSGIKEFTLTAIADDGCESMAQLSVFVSQPNSEYTLGPDISCTDEIYITYTANDPNHMSYTFNNDVNGDGGNIVSSQFRDSTLYVQPERDEYYINYRDSTTTRLIVTTAAGCKDTTENRFFLQKPEAFFIPDIVGGCIPFDVTFSDQSFSEEPIAIRAWDFGDGETGFFTADDTLITHTYTTTGLHNVVLNITDVEGCRDFSREVQIVAIDKDTIEAPPIPAIGNIDLTICVADTIFGSVSTDQTNLNIHIESDEGRFDHCWRSREFAHPYQYPGVYPINFTVEFFNIYIDSFQTNLEVNVIGSRSEIGYKIECDDPYTILLNSDKSINADTYAWYIEDKIASDQPAFSYTFQDTGDYMIYLETEESGVDCLHTDSTLVHIRDINAVIDLPEVGCATSPTLLDASLSQDVHDDCHAGYLWEFQNHRPREVGEDSLYHTLSPGFQIIKLTTEDINGCIDTAFATISVYDIEADFAGDTLICLPLEVDFTDLSMADTTLVSWEWDFGGGSSTEINPSYIFDVIDYDTLYLEDTITVVLRIEDVIGCIDTVEYLITTYDIISDITMDNGPEICQGESITFSASDYNIGGSFLNYNWEFENNGTSESQNPEVTYDEGGLQNVRLTFTENATGCRGFIDTLIDVTPTPIPNFSTIYDDEEFICFPEQIEFTNNSMPDEQVLYSWNFGNGAESNLTDPIIPFDKGIYEVQLIVRTFDGCRDTISKTYELVGPEGSFALDKDEICPGEEITLTLVDPVDVTSYTWDFGDGTQVDDQTPVSHIYDPQSSITSFSPTLILRSDDTSCERVQDIPIMLSSINADFADSTGICPGELSLFSNFVNPQTIRWEIDGQILEDTSNPSVTINSTSDSVTVSLLVTDVNGCMVERQRNVANPDMEQNSLQFPNVFSPNGDLINPSFNIVYNDKEIEERASVTTFRVYNRWGELLYDNNNPLGGWNGNYNGEVVPPDVYAYYIEVSIEGCNNRSRKGNVTVIK